MQEFFDVEIAMPTYNCAPWIDGFMSSLVSQDFSNWRIVVRDDRSTDNTSERLCAWQSRLGNRMVVLTDSGAVNLGVIGSYNAILAETTAPWVMSADPDDVWLPGKISRSLAAIRQIEAEIGCRTPVAVCTDAQVVDDALKPISPSFWKWSRMNPKLTSCLPKAAMESVALGSTMMVNRALLEEALPIGAGAPYQDSWLALVAVALGKLVVLPNTTILYRRHRSNATTDPYSAGLIRAARRTLESPTAPRKRLRKLLDEAASQAASFVTRYGNRLQRKDAEALSCLAQLPSLGLVRRRSAVVRHGLWFASPIKNAGLLAFL